MYRNLTIIYNPLAGAANFAAAIELVADEWRSQGWSVDIEPTLAAGHATQLAEAAVDSGCDLVLAAGGDGTLGEVVNGLAESDTIMGVIPAGTANSFARELHMPVPGPLQVPIHKTTQIDRLKSVSSALISGRVQAMDLGYRSFTEEQGARGRYWMLWASTGADGYLVHEVEPRPKWAKKLGWSSYVLQGIAVLPNFSHVRAHVEVDGHSVENDCVLVLISNSRRYAGGLLTLSQEAYLDDGLLEIWLFGGRGLSSISRHALRALRGQHLQEPDTILIRGQQISIRTEPPMPVQMDGDPAEATPLICSVKPHSLRLLVPETAPVSLFQQRGVPLAEAIA